MAIPPKRAGALHATYVTLLPVDKQAGNGYIFIKYV